MLYKSYKIFIKGIKVCFVVEEKIAIAQTSTFDTENKQLNVNTDMSMVKDKICKINEGKLPSWD